MPNDVFKIYFRVFQENRPYHLQVEQFYASPQVLRFKVFGKEKEMLIEKRLFLKRQPWKIISNNITFKDVAKNEEFIQRVQECIDRYLKGPEPPRIHPKNLPGNMPV